MSLGTYSFPAIKGHQGQHDYYLIQCPLRLVPRLFLFDEAEVPVSLRRARSVDPVRAAEITKYLGEEPEAYVLAPIIATIGSTITFEAAHGGEGVIGRVSIPITAQIILQDGQHRRVAIQQLLAKTPASGDDTIPVMLVPDENFTRSQRLYTVLNNGQTKNTRSQRVLHERSDLATLVQQLIDEVPLFQGRIELEKTTISNRSTALFTLSAVYQANEALLGIHKGDPVDIEHVDIAQQFWRELGEIIPEWQHVIAQTVAPAYLRQNYIHSHTVTLIALGKAGHALVRQHPADWPVRLQALAEIDWRRSNTKLWEGRAMLHGKMSKATDSIKLSASAIKQVLHVTLTSEEQELEKILSSK